jgi:hypothetical protein
MAVMDPVALETLANSLGCPLNTTPVFLLNRREALLAKQP